MTRWRFRPMLRARASRFRGDVLIGLDRFIDPDLLLRTYRDPLAWVGLLVDALPLLGIIMFGWGATPLVALYWLENLVVGGVNVARMAATAASGIAKFFSGLFLIPFFIVHYGMFCWGHGTFLAMFSENGPESDHIMALIGWALESGPHMEAFVGAIIAVSVLFFAVDFIGKGEFREIEPIKLMFMPYGRIVSLHVAIILGAAFTLLADEPLVGVLGILMLRFVFGIILAVMRRLRIDKDTPIEKVLASSM